MHTRVRRALSLLVPALLATWLLIERGRKGDEEVGPIRRDPNRSEASPRAGERSPPPTEAAPAVLKGHTETADEVSVPLGAEVVVRAKAGFGMPGAKVVAKWSSEGGRHQVRVVRTGANGRADLADAPLDGSAVLEVWLPTGPDSEVQGGKTRLTSAEVVVTVDEGLPLLVRCVDDLTGREVGDADVRGLVPRPAPDAGFPAGAGWIVALAKTDRTATVEFRVEPPAGFVAWDPARFLASIGAWTRELEVVYPLRREADVWVTVLDHVGRLEPRARVEGFVIAGIRASGRQTETAEPGVSRVRGVPFFRRAALTVMVSTPDREGVVRESVELPDHPFDRTEILVELPPPGVELGGSESVIGLGGGAGGAFGGRSRPRRTGEAIVVVRRHNGTPASNARVTLGRRSARTDADGRVRFAQLPVGEHRVVVHAVGLLPLEGVVLVKAGEAAHLELREPEGGAVDVLVTDADGDPLPYATLHVDMPSKGAWVDEQDGRQRLDPFTDHRGRRRLERLETGTVTIRAAWGGRMARMEVRIHERRLTPVTLVPR